MRFNLDNYIKSIRYYFGDVINQPLISIDRDKYDHKHIPCIGDIVEIGFYRTIKDKFNQPIKPNVNQFDLCLDWYKFKIEPYRFEHTGPKLFQLKPLEKLKYTSNFVQLIDEREFVRLSLKGIIRNRTLKQNAGDKTMKAEITQFPKLDIVDKLKLLFDIGAPIYLGIKSKDLTKTLVIICIRKNDLNQTEVLFKSDIPEIANKLVNIDINIHYNPFNSKELNKYEELELLNLFRSHTWFMRYLTGSLVYGLSLDIRNTNHIERLVYESNLPLSTKDEPNKLSVILPDVKLLEGTDFILKYKEVMQITESKQTTQPMKKLEESTISIKTNELDSKSKRKAVKKEQQKIKKLTAYLKGLTPRLKPTKKEKQRLYFTDMGIKANESLICVKNIDTKVIERIAKSTALDLVNIDKSLVIVSKQEWKDWKRNKGIEPKLCTTPMKPENRIRKTEKQLNKSNPKSGKKQIFTTKSLVKFTTGLKGNKEQTLKSKTVTTVARNKYGKSEIYHPLHKESIQIHPNAKPKKKSSVVVTTEVIKRNIGTTDEPIIVTIFKRHYTKLKRKTIN